MASETDISNALKDLSIEAAASVDHGDCANTEQWKEQLESIKFAPDFKYALTKTVVLKPSKHLQYFPQDFFPQATEVSYEA